MIDVDEFKLINEKYGHLAGDQTLQALGKLMTGIFFKKDILGRMGGDEFAVFITKASAKELISDKVECLKRRFQQSGRNLGVCRNLSITAGADFVQRKDTFESIYYRADCAMRSGKRNDKGTLSFYEVRCFRGRNGKAIFFFRVGYGEYRPAFGRNGVRKFFGVLGGGGVNITHFS